RRVSRRVSPLLEDPFFRRFFGGRGGGIPRERVQRSLGSGVIVGPDGTIVTNNHVIKNATDIKVVLSDKREFEAELILKDERTDLAVLRIAEGPGKFPFLKFADSDSLEVGDIVLAIGNPFGVGQTVTSGIISALGRSDVGVSDYYFFIQTDAAINPGNSGGALVDMGGRLIGINTAIFSRSGGSHGIGFAIPAELVARVVESALSDGRLVRPWFGARGQPVTSDLAASLGLEQVSGALVNQVDPDGPAARVDLRRGDVIVSIDGEAVSDSNDLRNRVSRRVPGSQVRLELIRDGRARQVEATLGEMGTGAAPAEPGGGDAGAGRYGLSVAPLPPDAARSLGLEPGSGVVVAEVDPAGPAAAAGIRRGD
ncbi:MAG: trypsin-like peptidase domain-containing protein, partial [Caulobacterales bacterium]|nr:trypsin-like peptidase domain-containing protein [Caulobacterales bacterium]